MMTTFPANGAPVVKLPPIEAYRRYAIKNHYEEGHLEIDEDAKVGGYPPGNGGRYVQAWLWVYDEEAEECTNLNG
jgi:hypothetical protein